ncbi:hypothetical protein ACKFKG_08535 [Phormidesmis sp. 146-35]
MRFRFLRHKAFWFILFSAGFLLPLLLNLGFWHSYFYKTSNPAQPQPVQTVSTSSFKVFDSLLYPDKPSIGMEKIWVTHLGFWRNYKDQSSPDEAACRQLARTAVQQGNRYFVVNIEHWPFDIRTASTADVQKTMQKIIQVIDWMKSERPSLKIGVYGFPPIRDYWVPLAKDANRSTKWQAANEFLRPLTAKVDFIAPSLYTFYTDQDAWAAYARANIAEAQRFGKPVLPFLWPRYHMSNRLLAYSYIPGDFWLKQLQTVRSTGAQGAILWDWNGFSRPASTALNPQDSWWQKTIKFIRQSSKVSA